MTKIGLDARLTFYRDGGISTYIRRLIQAFEQQNTNLDLKIFQSRKANQQLSNRFDYAKLWTPAHHRIERLVLSAELFPHQLDIFHSPDFIAPIRGAKRHVITVHDLTFLHYPQYLTADSRRYYTNQIAASCHHADAILAVSEATKSDLMSMLNVPENKITIQPHGAGEQYRPMTSAETEKVRAELHIPHAYILHVGTWEPRKNIIGLLKAYKMLLDSLPDAPPVLLVGRKGWLFEKSQAEIEALGINEHIIWRDTVTDAQLPAVYNMATMLVSPSFYEGFGMPALEAMACGIVPIVSNRSSLPEVVGDVGLLVNPDEPETIAEAMHKTLTDSAWYGAQSQAAIKRASQFTWERSAQIALQTYTSLI